MTDQLSDALAPVLSEIGLQLYDLELHGATLTLTIDRQGGVDLEALAAATHAVSRALDEQDPIAGRYTLEVSSPGLERRLRTPAHFQRAVGETVTVRTLAGTGPARRLTGRLAAADHETLLLEGDDVPEGSARLRYADIERARTVFEWGNQKAPSPSRAPAGSRRPKGHRQDATTERVTTQ